jgi:FtsP/CotA-like multicopper oxidase with cupredoxin domain
MRNDVLRRGDLVEVRSASEILGTLDDAGALDAVPFMPEMIELCGRRFVVDRRAEKVCDTVNTTLRSRHLPDTLFLGDERCDGSSHDGCQAECRLLWKEAWLQKVSPGDPTIGARDNDDAVAALRQRTESNTRRTADDGTIRYRCQATEMASASTPLSNGDPRPYLRELTSRNVSLAKFLRVMSRAAVWQPAHHFGRLPWPKGPNSKSPKSEPLDLQKGEWVRVKLRKDVEATLTTGGANRGLHFDTEMAAFCGQEMQVRGRVTHIIDEPSGKMLEFGSDCIKLETGFCSGERSTGRWFCAREIYPYFRECWLERIQTPVATANE